ncbi:T9SS type A sorting domain-containing protein [Bacteroidia bacterium]|nr:T9SS type A sorting domain-containing protein [Bacteroidia bacterium]MDB4107814.1 T9SS type A sorting domain-containing protein [Bacteroidia bacterium]MDB9883360.1 T9SS type A sorting domain-containing protein [Bacteroidia bacterium]
MKKILLICLLASTITSYGQVNIALNQTYDANTNRVNAINAFDGVTGNGTSSWSSRAYTGWIYVVFQDVSVIDSVTFEYQASPGNTTTQEIYTTTDGVNWVLDQTINLALNATTPSTHDVITYVFPSPITSTKGFRLKTTQNSSWVSWAEIEVWGSVDCADTLINDTITYSVSDITFQAAAPQIYLDFTDSLTTRIGGCDSVINHYLNYVFDPNHCTDTTFVTVQDTTFVTVQDTTFVTVQDTLVIDVTLTGVSAPNNMNTVKVYPNPAIDQITIDNGNLSSMAGYSMEIKNSLGQSVFRSLVNQQQFTINLNAWNGNGLYFLYIEDANSNIIEIKKIVLQ